MQGRISAAALGALVLSVLAAGCDDFPALPLMEIEPPDLAIGTEFDPHTAATVTGQLTWVGPVPEVKPFVGPLTPGSEGSDHTGRPWANPHAPVVEPGSRGVAGAVVFLRGVESRKARPWDHPTVRIEIQGGQFHIRQGEADSHSGFLRPGDYVEMVSRDPWLDIVQARGVAFFSLAFPQAGPVRSRPLNRPGLVELISGAGHYWMRAHLFVVEHPYYTRTDSAGRFTLPQVPPGDYRLVCWHPSWHEADHERDLGTMLITHLTFRPAVQVSQPIHLDRCGTVQATFTLSADDFDP
jgi:hypothetical protein